MQQKTIRKVPKNRVGYVSKGKSGKSILTVEQDITLKAGQKIILNKPEDNIKSLASRGLITKEQAEERLESLKEKASWKTHEADLLPDRD